MLGIPKLLHRAFVVGYVLPSALFYLYIETIILPKLEIHDLSVGLNPRIAGITVATIILSIVLTALNRPIIRVLEGYGDYNPLRLRLFFVKWRYRTKIKPLYEEAIRVGRARESDPSARSQIEQFSKKLSRAVSEFPDSEDLLLPTEFGNVYRAFEVYSRVTYGLDAIPAWPRLQLLLPSRVIDQLREARSYLDFNVNIVVLSCVAIIMLISTEVIEAPHYGLSSFLIPSGSMIYGWLMLSVSAKNWGEAVKSVFDLYRSRLARELGLKIPEDIDAERQMWREVSRFMLFRIPEPLTVLTKFRAVKQRGSKHRRKSGTSVDARINEAGP